VNIFDFITSSSRFQSSTQNNLNFPLKMLTGPVNSNEYAQLFQLRFTGLFETIPNKILYYQNSDNYFNTLESNILSMGNVIFGIFCACIVGMLVFCIPLLVCL
jgi:hypothetical protein